MTYDALVIGGGINGLSALYHLHRLGCRRLGLVERFRLGHDRGSSHGQSRVTRSAYFDPDYVKLMQVVHGQEWPRLERDAGCTLIYRTPGCFFGPAGGRCAVYARAVTGTGVDVEALDVTEARRRFPQFRFEATSAVLHDRTAGLVAAADTIAALTRLARRNGAAVHEEVRVTAIEPASDPLRVETDRGPLEAERVIVTAGAWLRDLLPCLSGRLKVIRQTVAYFRPAGAAEEFRPGSFPVWGYLAEQDDQVFYGLPEFGREGIKVARDLTVGAGDDPEEPAGAIDEAEVSQLRAFLEWQIVPRIDRILGAETCLYTMTRTKDFIIDLHPDNPRLVLGSACSGHGFKFGPMTGRALAELALHGHTEVPEFERLRPRFGLSAASEEERRRESV
jgi:sarcosine oxidase